ncbi:MAG: GNAT family N-acetyltransferase [Clostridia bacterium]|nr:GNAT family N-acetyltransferase [Clostridia bacterium]
MMSVQIKEVVNKKQLKTWVQFPNKMYKDNPNFVPFLSMDEMDTFNPKKNPAYEFCETRLFLAYKEGKVVGRIGGLINHAYNKKWNKNAIRYTRFDFIDDFEVSSALFNAVVCWGKERGYTEIMGPIGFTDMDHEGMLVEGFDQFNMSITFYNHPYYIDHMDKLGLRKDIDWVEYLLTVPEKPDERMSRISEHVLKKNGLTYVTYKDRKSLRADVKEAFELVDVCFSVLYGTVPLTPKVIDKVADDYVPIINLDYVCSIKDREGKIIGFGALCPSMAKALKKSNGKLFPFGMFRVLKALNGKNDVLEMYFVAVAPEYQKLGIPAILINGLLAKCIENGVKYCETGPELETNADVQSMWKTFESKQHKRRRCFIKEI